MNIAITGYTYTRQNLFDVFEEYPERDSLFFILPDAWSAKNGSVTFTPFTRSGFHIYHSPAFFRHSQYILIGGLFKGWMPFFIFRLAYIRFAKNVRMLYTAGEPNLLSTLYNALAARILGMKHVFLYWENIPYEAKDRGLKLKLKKAIIKINCALSDGAICGMHKAQSILKTIAPNLPTVVSLHAGFDTERFRPGLEPKLRKKLGLAGKSVFLFVGSLSYRKGIHLVLDVLVRHPEWHFIIVGSGEYESELKLHATRYALQNRVTFIPWLSNEELPSIYNSADIFLYPSIPYQGWEEQFGYSIAEASLCNLPVISTHSGSIDEVLINGKTGIVIDPDDVRALESAMILLADDKKLCYKLGTEGRAYITSRYSHYVIAQNLFRFFSNIYANRK